MSSQAVAIAVPRRRRAFFRPGWGRQLLLQALQGGAILWIQHGDRKHVAFAAKGIALQFLCQPGIEELLDAFRELAR